MKQKIHYLFMLLLMLLTGVGGVKADEVFYTLSHVDGKNSSYDSSCDIDINGITWNVSGNSTMDPWRIGGKSITKTDRAVYSKTAMASAISKVELTVGAASSITVNSLKLIVASDANFSNKIDEVSATFSANSTITFAPTSGTEWASNAYYKFVFNVTVSVTSNKFVEFKEAKFYKAESSGPGDPIVSFANERFEVAKGKSAVNEISKPSDLDVTYESSDQGVASVNATTGEVTGVAIGEATITANWNAVVDKYNSGSKSYTVVVREPTTQELALLYESWSKSLAANDGTNELGVTSSNLDYNNWKEFSKVYQGGGQCGKLGTSSAIGKMTTNEIALTGNGTLTFKIKKYGSDSGKLKVSATGATIVGDSQFSPTSADEWTDCTINLVNGDGKVTIVLETTSKRMYIDDIMLLEAPTYTIDVVSNNVSYGSVVMENNVITATPAEDCRFATPAYTVTSGEAEVEQDGNTFIVTAKSDCQVQINFEAIPTHTVTFSVNGTETSKSFAEGSNITFDTPDDVQGKKFVGWTTAVIDGTTDECPEFVTLGTMGSADVTYYAVFANVTAGTATSTEDILTREWTGVEETTTYAEWFDMEAPSKAIYAGQSAGDKNSIQLRSNNSNSGVVSTTSGGKLKKVAVVWNGETADGRTLNVYGKNSAYSAATDLYGDNAGTLLGTIVKGTSTELTIPGDYEYVGLRSASGAMYLDEIDITWESGTPATYSGYCTTVKEQATIRLYLPNNPEGNLTEHQLSCGAAVILNVYTNSPGAITIQDMTDGITVKPNTDNKTVTLLASTNNGKVFSQPGEYKFRVVVGETDSYTSASVDFKLKVVKFKAYFNNLTGFEETKDLANGTNGGQLKDQLISNTQWGDASLKTWTSTNEDVATIDNDGNITLISTGQVRFIHSYTGNDYNEPCKISTGVMTVIDTTPTVLPTAPTIFHDSGEYEGSVKVSMTAPEGVDIYYTLSTTRNTEGTKYTAPITISENSTLTAWAVQDGVESEKVTREYTIVEKTPGAEVAEGYYTIKNNGNKKYVNVAGRKTVTFVDETATAAGTVIKVKADADGVKVLRSQGVDIPGYADKAMRYVPEIVKLVVNKLNNLGEGQLMGEAGLEALMKKFNEAFDEHLYLEQVGENSYRIYGRTPSMQHVVDFYAENKANVDAKLPMLEGKINAAIEKVLQKTNGSGQSILVPFKLKTVWQNMGGTLTEPVNEASTMKFYEEVLTSETNVWNFAYQTAMIYWGNLKNNDTFKNYIKKLGDYAKYIDKVENIRPNFKYYIVQKDNKLDIISEGNGELNADFTAWTLIPRTDFSVAFNEENVLNNKYYTTLYTDFAYTLPPVGVKAYKVTEVSKAGVAKKVKIEGTIPAQTPVLLEADAADTKVLTLSTEDGTAPADNILKGADALINQYPIKTAQVEDLFNFAKDILGESFYNTYIQKYEHLMMRNAGTVNNKYFFGLTEKDMELCTYETEDGDDCVIRNLGTGENQPLAFYGDWQAPKSNQAFLVSETFNPVLLMLKGDVNRDGRITIADVTALVNIILGKATYPADADKYDFEAAHVNADEDITIADVTALVNIILGKTQN